MQTERRFSSVTERLSLLDYRKTLERGFTLVRKEKRSITSSNDLHEGDMASVIFHDGVTAVTITGKEELP